METQERRESMNNMSAVNREAGIYIIDQDYRIVYLNEVAKAYYPNLKAGMYCYQEIGKESSPCQGCPGTDRNPGQTAFYNTALKLWFDTSSGEVDWPGYEGCRLIMFRPVDEENKNLYYNPAEGAVYDELIELNLAANTYKILFYQRDKHVTPELEGQLDSMLFNTADSMIHPEDREEFQNFWNLSTLLNRLLESEKILKKEFRSKRMEGEYGWTGLTVVLFRYKDQEDPIVMCYIQDADRQNKKQEEELEKFRVRREEMDSLTALYRYGPFFEKAERLLERQAGKEYFMVAIDIEHFKLFNEWYGEEKGDRFLIELGSRLKAMEEFCDSIAGYMGGDDFVILLPAELSLMRSLEDEINGCARQFGGNGGFFPAFGVYRIEDRSLSVSMMYDRAAIALNSVRGIYTKRVGWYDPSMKQKMESDQVLLSEIQSALERKEFVFYVQPQCNMISGKIIGLEALVRWHHPIRGVVPPGEFIPLLERNGFITYLDLYVWDLVCQKLSSWIGAGKHPVPISVNVSRIDIYAIDVVGKFKELVRRYEIDPKYLEIEITESAYAEDYELIRKVVEDLRRAGFRVFMDDFGSGYSSLNMLKDVNVDVIKIDTKFLDMTESSKNRGMGILETIVRMARVMQMRIIAEGVEEREQAEFLKNIGCIYGQGYYFHQPLTTDEAETLLKEENKVDFRGIQAHHMKQLRLDELFNENITSEAMLNNMLGAIALYEVYEDQCEVLRVNEEYYRVTGDNPAELEERRWFLLNKVYKDDVDWLLNIFENAYNNPIHGAEGIFRRYRLSGELMWMHLRVFFLREQDERRLFFGSVRDATEQMEQRQKLEESQKILGNVLKRAGKNISFENMPQESQWAVSAIFSQFAPDGLLGICCEPGFPLYFANNDMLSLLEYDSYEAFADAINGKVADIIHPEDLKLVQENILRFASPGMEYTFRLRMKKRLGGWLWLMTRGRVIQAEDGKPAVVSACMDITDTVLTQEKLRDANDELEFLSSRMLGGYFRCRLSEQMEFLHVSPRFLEILGYTEKELAKRFGGQLMEMIHPDDREEIRRLASSLKPGEILKKSRYRVLSKRGYTRILCPFKLSVKAEDKFLYGVMVNIDDVEVLQRLMKSPEGQESPGQMPARALESKGIARMEAYMAHRRIRTSALLVFELCKPRAECDEAGRAGKALLARSMKQLKFFFRDTDIICRSGEHEILVLCKNIREKDMKSKLKQILWILRQDMTGEEEEVLSPAAAGLAMIGIWSKDFKSIYEKARLSLEQSGQL